MNLTQEKAIAVENTNETIENSYYVYEYFSDRSGEIQNDEGEIIHISKGDVYYVGRGRGNRARAGRRNEECEKFKKIFGFSYRIIKDGMDDKEASLYEREKIIEYIENGMYLTNIKSGSAAKADDETKGKIKYLVRLCEAMLIKMSNDNISDELECRKEIVGIIRSDREYAEKINIVIPENLKYLLEKYDYDLSNEKDLKFYNIKYVLGLVDRGVIKATQSQIADYYGESEQTVSGIRKNKFGEMREVKPENLSEILIKFSPNNVTEEEKNKGYVMYIVKNLIDTGILKMTVRDLARDTKHIYGISEMQIADMRRRGRDIKLFKPDGEMFAMLFSKYYFPD